MVSISNLNLKNGVCGLLQSSIRRVFSNIHLAAQSLMQLSTLILIKRRKMGREITAVHNSYIHPTKGPLAHL